MGLMSLKGSVPSFFFPLPGDKFEDPCVTPYSSPPDLPDVMKPQETAGATVPE